MFNRQGAKYSSLDDDTDIAYYQNEEGDDIDLGYSVKPSSAKSSKGKKGKGSKGRASKHPSIPPSTQDTPRSTVTSVTSTPTDVHRGEEAVDLRGMRVLTEEIEEVDDDDLELGGDSVGDSNGTGGGGRSKESQSLWMKCCGCWCRERPMTARAVVFGGGNRTSGGSKLDLRADNGDAVHIGAQVPSTNTSSSNGRIDLDSSNWQDVDPRYQFPPNVVNNQKYTWWNFIFLFLYHEFKFFFNLYFLVVALSQFVPILRVGFLFTYIAPLAVVLAVAMVKEAYDDISRYRRDAKANSERYHVIVTQDREEEAKGKENGNGGLLGHHQRNHQQHHGDDSEGEYVVDTAHTDARTISVTSSELKVGDLVVLHANQRVPCDCVLLRTKDPSGCLFIRTDQLDGETDWKLRRAPGVTQSLPNDRALASLTGRLVVEAPHLNIYSLIGNFTTSSTPSSTSSSASSSSSSSSSSAPSSSSSPGIVEPISLEQAIWANTVIATSSCVCVVVYTGAETRSGR